MPSDYPNTPKALFREANQIADTDLGEYFKSTVQRRWCEAMVVDTDEFANRYVINIHMKGLSGAPTHRKILATNLEPTRLYLKGWPCQVIYDGRMAIMRGWQGPVGFLPDVAPDSDEQNDYPRRVPGWITDLVKGTWYAQDDSGTDVVAADYRVYFSWGYRNLDNAGGGRGDANDVLYTDTVDHAPLFDWSSLTDDGGIPSLFGFVWPRPIIVADRHADVVSDLSKYVSSGFLIMEGSSISRPDKKYQVYTPIDDTLIPIWTTARFTDDT